MSIYAEFGENELLINKERSIRNVRSEVYPVLPQIRQEPPLGKKAIRKSSPPWLAKAIEMIHPDMANVSKAQIKAKLAVMLKAKEEAISVYGLSTKFGGGRSTGFAMVYDNVDLRKKYDSKTMLKRVGSDIF